MLGAPFVAEADLVADAPGAVNADFMLEHDERRVARPHGEHGERSLAIRPADAGALAGDDLALAVAVHVAHFEHRQLPRAGVGA